MRSFFCESSCGRQVNKLTSSLAIADAPENSEGSNQLDWASSTG